QDGADHEQLGMPPHARRKQRGERGQACHNLSRQGDHRQPLFAGVVAPIILLSSPYTNGQSLAKVTQAQVWSECTLEGTMDLVIGAILWEQPLLLAAVIVVLGGPSVLFVKRLQSGARHRLRWPAILVVS